MEADIHSFEQFVGAVTGSGQQPFAIGGETSNESIRRMVDANRARIRVNVRNRGREINLSAQI